MNTTYKILNDNQIKNQLPSRLYIAYGVISADVVYSSGASEYDALKRFNKEHPKANFSGMLTYNKPE